MLPTTFLDTNIFKLAATALRRYQLEGEQSLQWGPHAVNVPVYREVVINPNDRIGNAEQKAEADLLPSVAALGTQGRMRFVISAECRYELWGLPNMDTETGLFYGASVDTIDAPFEYARVMGGGGINGKQAQQRFLEGIDDPRFLAFQKATGAYQGLKPRNANQMLDAFHLWCAEAHGCSFLLTEDTKLIRVLQRSKLVTPVRVVRASELLHAVAPA